MSYVKILGEEGTKTEVKWHIMTKNTEIIEIILEMQVYV